MAPRWGQQHVPKQGRRRAFCVCQNRCCTANGTLSWLYVDRVAQHPKCTICDTAWPVQSDGRTGGGKPTPQAAGATAAAGPLPPWVQGLYASLKANGNAQQMRILEAQFPALVSPAPAMQDTTKLWAAANRRLEVAHKQHDEALTKLLKLEDQLAQQKQKLVDAALELSLATEAQAKAQALAQEVPAVPAATVEAIRANLQEEERARALQLEQSIKQQQQQLQELLVAAQARGSKQPTPDEPAPMDIGEGGASASSGVAAQAAPAGQSPAASGKKEKAEDSEAHTARRLAHMQWAELEAKKQKTDAVAAKAKDG